MRGDPRAELLGLLRTLRTRLASASDGSPEEVAEIDGLLRDLEKGEDRGLRGISAVFLPTGIVQDIAIDGGWGDEFCRIADRVDALLAQLGRGSP